MNCGKKVRLNPTKMTRAPKRAQPAGDLRPPEMDPAEIGHHGTTHHDVVEVGDDEVGAVQVNVRGKRGEEKSGEAAHGKQADEAECVEHGRLVGDGAFVECCRPIEDFDGRRDGHEKTEDGKNQARVNGLAGDEHVVSPDQETDYGDGHTGERHKAVAENALAGKAGDELADYAHARKNHDVHGGMRIEPEQVLEENRVAADRGVKDANVEQPLEAEKEEGDGDNRRSEDEDDARCVDGPDEEGQAEPRKPRSAHLVDGHDEIQASEDGGEPGDENPESYGNNLRVRI